MDAPSTGWVTALAGLLARGSLLSCVRPSRFPSGHADAGSPLTVAGAATVFCKFVNYEPQIPVFPLSSPELPGEPAQQNVPLNRRTSQAPPPSALARHATIKLSVQPIVLILAGRFMCLACFTCLTCFTSAKCLRCFTILAACLVVLPACFTLASVVDLAVSA